MENNTDKFEPRKNNVFFTQKNKSENFFMLKDSIDIILPSQTSYRRLNDYDSNMLEADAYKNVSDDLFKLEYKISRIENELRSIDAQIQVAREISDYSTIENLNNKKRALSDEHLNLVATYNEKSLSTRITESLAGTLGFNIKNRYSNLKKYITNISESILLRLPKPFASAVELKKSLNKLENINKSVDELINLNHLPDETSNKYEQLSKYIARANNIQNQITKYLKN